MYINSSLISVFFLVYYINNLIGQYIFMLYEFLKQNIENQLEKLMVSIEQAQAKWVWERLLMKMNTQKIEETADIDNEWQRMEKAGSIQIKYF